MRRAAAVDANQPSIVKALREVHCYVQCLHTVGKGCPDLLVGRGGRTYLLEVKDGAKPQSKQALTEDQVEWHRCWRGPPVVVVTSVEEALRAVGVAA